jgi:hypothetical protein
VLFYTLELVLTRMTAHTNLLRAAMVTTACILGVKGIA